VAHQHVYPLAQTKESKSSYVTTDGSVGQSVLMWSTHLGLKTRSLLLSDSCGFVYVGRSLWRENGPAVYKCCWSSPAQSFLGLSPAGLVTIFYCLRFETPPTWRARTPYLYPPGTGWPSYSSQKVKVKVILRPTVQSASLSWCEAPIWGLRPDLYYCQPVAGLLMWGALSDEDGSVICQTQSAVISLLPVCTIYIL
jgi:hypothetical protein